MVNNETKRNCTETSTSEALMGLDEGDRDAVQSILTLPGIVGLAFLDQAMPLRVYGWDGKLEIRQPEIFVKTVTQILRSMPAEFCQLEFKFGSYSICLRRLATDNAIAILMNAAVDLREEASRLAAFSRVVLHNRLGVQAILQSHQQMMQKLSTESVARDNEPQSGLENLSLVQQAVLISAFNRLAEIAGRYLGTTIMVRHLTRSRPSAAEWVEELENVTIDRRGILTMTDKTTATTMTAAQRLAFSVWIQEFVKQCSKIIRNFDTLARKEGLTEEESAILFDSVP